MGKRHYLGFLLLSITAFLSCSNVSRTSSIIGSAFFQLPEELNFNRSFNGAFLPDKRILPAGGALINNERNFAVSEIYKPQNKTTAVLNNTQNGKCSEIQQIRKSQSELIFGATTYLLIGNS